MADQISASHILLMHSESERSSATRTKSEAVDLINNIKTRVDAGDDFNDLAKEYSDCPSSNEGGELGSFGRGAMVPEFETAAFALDVDGTSDVVETAFGFHLIKRTS
jgi:parvulin-like peptidyl-prolyl isomerase|tara:strand:+ start:166 stop:486 length:321 start_codon:yes stop_codon:yes gene_type:complete